MSGTESARVEQVDRDNAAEYLLFNHRVTPDDAERIKAGEWDATEHVRFFTRIRLTAIDATTEAAANHIERHYDSGDRDTHFERRIVDDLRNNRHLEPRHD